MKFVELFEKLEHFEKCPRFFESVILMVLPREGSDMYWCPGPRILFITCFIAT